MLESYTLQVLPPDLRPRAMQSLARLLAPAGELLLICRGREPTDDPGQVPWPLTREELTQISSAARLVEGSFEDYLDGETPPVRRFRVVYKKSDGPHRLWSPLPLGGEG